MAGYPDVHVSDPFGRDPERIPTAPSASLADTVAVLRGREGWAKRAFRIWVNGDEAAPDGWSTAVPREGDFVLISPIPQYQTALYVIKAIVAAFQSGVTYASQTIAGAASYVAPGLVTAAGVESAIYGMLTGAALGKLSQLISNHPGAGSGSYGITGAANTADQDGFCPLVLGKRRVIPRLAASCP